MSNIMSAHYQWATRPADERYNGSDTVEIFDRAIRDAVHRRDISEEVVMDLHSIRAVAPDDDQILLGLPDGRELVPTNWGFRQIATIVEAPADYLTRLPARLAAVNLQYGIIASGSTPAKLLLHDENNGLELTAVTGPKYGRIYNAPILQALKELAIEADLELPLTWAGIREGLYVSKEDMFCCLIQKGASIVDGGGKSEELYKGIIVSQSEVGKAKYRAIRFMLQYICGNHIIWGAKDIEELNIIHFQNAPSRWLKEAVPAMKRIAQASTAEEQKVISAAKQFELPTPDEARIDWFQNKGFAKKTTLSALEYADQELGQSKSLWDAVYGFTRLARDIQFTDKRVQLEQQASKLLDLVAA